MATTSASTKMIAMTIATIGRWMKNLAMTSGPFRPQEQVSG